MARPIIYGPAYSTYARTVRLALEEKGVPYDLVEVDIFSGANKSPEHLARHPFGKVPAFAHDDLSLIETNAITRYVNETFEGPPLEPGEVRARALMMEAIGIIDSYAYPCLIGTLVTQRVVVPMTGGTTDEAVINEAMPQAEICIRTLERILDGGSHLGGDVLNRADLFLIPVYDYVAQTPEGQKLLASAPNLQRWWEGVKDRPSVTGTRPSLG